MIQFIQAGGIGGLVVLLFSGALLVTSARAVWDPTPKRYPAIKALSIATTFAIFAAIVSNLAAVMTNITGNDEWAHDPDMHLILMQGIGESLTPGMIGFTALALSWMFVALRLRRHAEE